MRLYEWCLATFHTVLFFAIVVLLGYLSGGLGELLAALNTLVGAFVFLLFWIATWFCTRSALVRIFRSVHPVVRNMGRAEIKRALYLAPVWAGINGMLFLQVLLAAGLLTLVAALVTNTASFATGVSPLQTIGQALVFGAFAEIFGLIAAFIVGAVLGVVFVAIDGLLIAAAQSLAGGFRSSDRPAGLSGEMDGTSSGPGLSG